MALKTHWRCKVCKLILAGDDKLLKRLYNSSHFKGKAGETLQSILEAYEGQFSRENLWRHLKVHQALSDQDLQKNIRDRISQTQTTNLVKEAITHNEARSLVIEKGYKRLKSGRMTVNTRDLLQATKQAADIEERQKDRSVAVMDMVFRFASGEMKPNEQLIAGDDPAAGRSVLDITT